MSNMFYGVIEKKMAKIEVMIAAKIDENTIEESCECESEGER